MKKKGHCCSRAIFLKRKKAPTKKQVTMVLGWEREGPHNRKSVPEAEENLEE